MILGKIKRLFRARFSNDDGSPVPFVWIADPFAGRAACVNPASGRMIAYVSHDGHGKYEALIVVTFWRALKLIRDNKAWLASLLSFPRVTLELVRLKVDVLRNAQDYVEALLRST
jgi:hypothetical protein